MLHEIKTTAKNVKVKNRRFNHRGLKALLFLTGCIFLYFLFCLGLVCSKVNDCPTRLSGYQTILVLGSEITGSSKNPLPTPVTKSRLDAALKVAQFNPHAKIVLSGGKGKNEPVSEAYGMEKYLEKHSVSTDRIIKEDHAINTYTNLRNSKIFCSKKTLLITSDFHLARSLTLAKAQGLKLTGYAAKTPQRSLSTLSYFYVRETIGMGRALIFGR